MLYKKSIVLSAMDGSLKKAVVTLDGTSGSVKGSVMLYNFGEEPMGALSLGILVGDKVTRAALTRIGYMNYQFSGMFSKVPDVFSCALVMEGVGRAEALLLGGSQGDFEEALLGNLDLLGKKPIKEIEKRLDESIGKFEDEEEIEELIDKEIEKMCSGCAGCQYKRAFYDDEENKPAPPCMSEEEPCVGDVASRQSVSEALKSQIVTGKLRVPESGAVNFMDEIGSQIKKLFDAYPREEVLEEIIPASKWVKVDFDGTGKGYVVGLVSEDGQIKYICYGVAGQWASEPPKDFNPMAKWLAIDLEKPTGAGYWITYQDAWDGELVNVTII